MLSSKEEEELIREWEPVPLVPENDVSAFVDRESLVVSMQTTTQVEVEGRY